MPSTEMEKARDRTRYQANREIILARAKETYQNNKQVILERTRQYKSKNRTEINKKQREQYEKDPAASNIRCRQWRIDNPEVAKRRGLIRHWRERGVVSDDEALYNTYLAATTCEDCEKKLDGVYGDGSDAYRCLDHCHVTGAFRGVVCRCCNTKRGI
jgi:hypothetical protein